MTPLIVLPLFNTLTMYMESAVQGKWQPLGRFLIQETTGALAAVPVLIPLILLGNRLLVRRDNWFLLIPLHGLLFMAFAWSVTTLMYSLRIHLYPYFNLTIDPPPLAARYWYEARLQLLAYGLFLAVIHLAAAWEERVGRERELAATRLKAAELETQASRAQFAALRAQLQPHFLFNALNVISAVVYEDAERADRLIAQLADLLRLALAHPQARTVALRHEIQFIERYLTVMQARFQERLLYRLEIEQPALDWGVPYLILQPLVENSIKHMEKGEGRPAEILVRATLSGDTLALEVRDNGPGPAADEEASRLKAPEGCGVGLANIRERLATVYGHTASLTLAAHPEGGTHAFIRLPCRPPETEPA